MSLGIRAGDYKVTFMDGSVEHYELVRPQPPGVNLFRRGESPVWIPADQIRRIEHGQPEDLPKEITL